MPFASRKNVSPIGSRKASFDEASPPTAQPIFHTNHLSVPAATLTGWNRRIFLHLKLFNLSAPLLKIVKMCVGPYSSRKSNRKTGTSIKV